ncbi:MAG: SMC family ATPase [Candidatus Woesearchaeota archaeon]
MRIKSLSLVNFRSYKNEKLYFPEGSILLAGDIGAGKSSILFAIEFALFGLRKKHLTGPALLRKGSKQCEVELNFEVNNKDVTIKRILKKSSDKVEQTAGHIIINGAKQDLTAIELKAKILELLGYPMDLLSKTKNLIYTYTVYTPQEEMKEILTEESDIRLDVLRKVFGFDKYKRVRENCAIATKEMKSRIKILESMTSDYVEKKRFETQISEQMKILKEQLNKTDADIEKLKIELESKNINYQILEKQKDELQDLKKSVTGTIARFEERSKNLKWLQAQMKSTEEEFAIIQNRLKDLEIKTPESNAEQLEKDLTQNEEKMYSMINEENGIKNRMLMLDNNISQLNKEIAESEKKKELVEQKREQAENIYAEIKAKENHQQHRKELEEKLKIITESLQEHNIKKKASQETIEKIEKLDNCPLCLQQVSHDHKQQIHGAETSKIFVCIEEMNRLFLEKRANETELKILTERLDAIAIKEKELSKLDIEIKMFQQSIIQLDEKLKLYGEYRMKKAELELKLQETQKNDLIKLKKEIDNMKLKIKEWQNYNLKLKEKDMFLKKTDALVMTKVKQSDQELELKKELDSLEQTKKNYQERIDSFQGLEMRIKLAKEELDILKKNETTHLVRQASITKELQGNESQMKILKLEVDKKEKEKNEMARLEQMHNWIEQCFVPLTIAIERQIMVHVYQLFNELFKKWLNMLIEDDMLTVRLNQDFSPIIEQNGFDVYYEHLSGGEKTSIALAYRLALNKVVNDLYKSIGTHDLIILDEPTDGFSREHLDKLREVFDELNMKQLILVSHENKIESFVQHVIRINKNEHVSSIFS